MRIRKDITEASMEEYRREKLALLASKLGEDYDEAEWRVLAIVVDKPNQKQLRAREIRIKYLPDNARKHEGVNTVDKAILWRENFLRGSDAANEDEDEGASDEDADASEDEDASDEDADASDEDAAHEVADEEDSDAYEDAGDVDSEWYRDAEEEEDLEVPDSVGKRKSTPKRSGRTPLSKLPDDEYLAAKREELKTSLGSDFHEHEWKMILHKRPATDVREPYIWFLPSQRSRVDTVRKAVALWKKHMDGKKTSKRARHAEAAAAATATDAAEGDGAEVELAGGDGSPTSRLDELAQSALKLSDAEAKAKAQKRRKMGTEVMCLKRQEEKAIESVRQAAFSKAKADVAAAKAARQEAEAKVAAAKVQQQEAEAQLAEEQKQLEIRLGVLSELREYAGQVAVKVE